MSAQQGKQIFDASNVQSIGLPERRKYTRTIWVNYETYAPLWNSPLKYRIVEQSWFEKRIGTEKNAIINILERYQKAKSRGYLV